MQPQGSRHGKRVWFLQHHHRLCLADSHDLEDADEFEEEDRYRHGLCDWCLYVYTAECSEVAHQSANRLIVRSVCGVASFRQYIAYNSGRGSNPTASIIQIKIWSKRAPVPSLSAVLMTPRTVAIEVNIAIIIACLPALTPLFKRIPLLASLIPLSVRSKFSHAGVAQRAPWPQKLSGPH